MNNPHDIFYLLLLLLQMSWIGIVKRPVVLSSVSLCLLFPQSNVKTQKGYLFMSGRRETALYKYLMKKSHSNAIHELTQSGNLCKLNRSKMSNKTINLFQYSNYWSVTIT